MRLGLILVALLFSVIDTAAAQSVQFLEVDTGRKMPDGSAAVQRAIVTLPQKRTEVALLLFRGNPGYMLAKSVADKERNLGWFKGAEPIWLAAGITMVQMDCPTDQWGDSPRPPATKCFSDYRSTPDHADDVRKIIAELKSKLGLTRIFILGHSAGSISSRWLAINLRKDEVAGIIHSSAINIENPRGFMTKVIANLSKEFPRRAAGMPMLHVHNEKDGCDSCPYAFVKNYAGENLVTVHGGIAEGDPCGGKALHSHNGREAEVGQAVATWITTGRVEKSVGE